MKGQRAWRGRGAADRPARSGRGQTPVMSAAGSCAAFRGRLNVMGWEGRKDDGRIAALYSLLVRHINASKSGRNLNTS